MKIHILGTRGFPSSYGGFETLVRHLAPYLVEAGHEVTVFGRDPASPRFGSRTVDGVRVLRTVGLDGVRTSTLTHGLSSVLATAYERPDVALMMNVAHGYFLPILRARGIPVMLNVDGIEWERAKWSATGRAVFRAGARMTARWADDLIADSEAIAKYWYSEFGRNSVFIPYGGDSHEGTPSVGRVRALGLEPGKYILIVARFVPENNVEIMLAAGERVGVPVVVVGAGGGSDLEQRVRARHDPPRVTALGHVSDQDLLMSLWAHCGVYLHGHTVGGTNPALVQAMGLGAPVLAADTEYNREVLVQEQMLVKLHVERIAHRAAELLESPEQRSAASAWGRQRVAEVYNWDAVCSAYEAALQGVVGSSVT